MRLGDMVSCRPDIDGSAKWLGTCGGKPRGLASANTLCGALAAGTRDRRWVAAIPLPWLPLPALPWLLAPGVLAGGDSREAGCDGSGEGDAKRKMYLLLGSMGVFHVVLVFLFKIYFFHYRP